MRNSRVKIRCFGIIALLCMLSLTLAGCDDKQPITYPSLVKDFLPSEKYPKGSRQVTMGDTVLRLPHGIATISPQGGISLPVGWPELEFIRDKKFRSSPEQRFIDSVEIFFTPPRRGPMAADPNQQGADFKEREIKLINSFEGRLNESKEFPGFLETNSKPSNYYLVMNRAMVNPQGLPLVFMCDTFNLDVDWDQVNTMIKLLPQCNIISYWPDGHRIRIRFRRKHMQDAAEIYQKVIALHDSFITHTTQPIQQQGE